MVRCAVLISGQPRSVLESYSNIQNKIIQPNNADVFVHSWIDPDMVGKPYWSEWLIEHRKLYEPHIETGPASTNVPENIDKIILDCYNPKKYLFEPSRFFEYDPILDQRKMAALNPQNAFSQLYSMYMANQMRKQYEIESNIKYDVIMRIRFGMVFDSDIWPLEHFSGHDVCFISSGFGGFNNSCAFLNHISVCDHFVIGNSKIIDIYTDTFNQLEFLVKNNYCHLQCEDAIGSWVRVVNKIPAALLDISYRINVLD